MTKRGEEAESFAFEYLCRHGLRPVTRNYSCRFGEIDLIMRDDEMLVFVEVRQRRSSSFGGAAASIDERKQSKLIAAARHYLGTTGGFQNCRFDAVLLNGDNCVEWIRDAFGE